MRVFRHLIVGVGVGAAITFSNMERSASASPPAPSQDNTSESNQLDIGSDFKSAPKNGRERNAQTGYVSSVSPPTESQPTPAENQSLELGANFQATPTPASPEKASNGASPRPRAREWTRLQLGANFKSTGKPSVEATQSPDNHQPEKRASLQLDSNFKSGSKPASHSAPAQEPSAHHLSRWGAHLNPPLPEPQAQSEKNQTLQLGANFKASGKPAPESTQPTPAVPVAQQPVPYEKVNLTPQQSAKVLAFTLSELRHNRSQTQGRRPSELAQNETPGTPSDIPDVTTPSETPEGTSPALPSRTPLDNYPPLTPDGTLQTQPPTFLEPSPNPLLFPTEPEEVRIERTQPITLQQAIDLARRGSPGIQVAELQVEQSRSALREQRASLYPDVTLQVDLNRQLSAGGELGVRAQQRRLDFLESRGQRPPGTAEPRNFGQNSLNTTLQLSYDVDLFGRRTANIRAAEEQLRFRELELERLVEQLRFDISNSYYDLQDADGRVAIGEAAVRNAQKSLADAEALERAGVGTRFAVLQAQVNLANEQQRLNEARRDQRVRRRRLAEQINVSQLVDLTAADPVEQAGTWRLSLEESILQALKNRAELEQQLVQRDFSEQQRRSVLASRLPQLSVFANYNVLGLDPDEGDYFASRGWADGYSIGARLTWNIFDGGAAQASAEQREYDKAIAETRFEQLRNQVRREVEQAYFELESSFASIETAEAGVLQAREALRLARLRFQAGVGTQTDVIQAETDLTRAERNRLLAIIGYNRALSSLQRAITNLPGGDLSDQP